MGILKYEDFLIKISGLNKYGMKPGLSRIKKLLKMMGNPEKKLKFIHVAGTNGKGSVCNMLANILTECGYKTGLYTSPSVSDYRERIKINGCMISNRDFSNLSNSMFKFSNYFQNDNFTEFEFTTALAFQYFYENNCDIVVLETGMGGKFDATNVIEAPICSVITGISIDHTNFLGENILQIAKEKLGIVKENSNLVMGDSQEDEIYSLARKICDELNTNFLIADDKSIKDFKPFGFNKSFFKYENSSVELGLLGEHQRHNVSVVFSVLKIIKNYFEIPKEKIFNALKKTKVPYRLEVLKLNPLVILDASHNVESIKALAQFIESNLKNRSITAVSSMFRDKDIEGCFKIIGKYFNSVVAVKSKNPRAVNEKELENIIKKYNKNTCSYENLENGLKYALSKLNSKDVLIVFGTFSIMDESKKFILAIDN